jgi:hypothetical protein
MNRIWDQMAVLRSANAQHRKGWRMQDATQDQALRDLCAEMFELIREPDNPTEWADVLTVLVHYAMIRGWDRETLVQHALQKISVRFDGESGRG